MSTDPLVFGAARMLRVVVERPGYPDLVLEKAPLVGAELFRALREEGLTPVEIEAIKRGMHP